MLFAIWVPLKAKKRNMMVPTNSPDMATKWSFHTLLGDSLFCSTSKGCGFLGPTGRRRGLFTMMDYGTRAGSAANLEVKERKEILDKTTVIVRH